MAAQQQVEKPRLAALGRQRDARVKQVQHCIQHPLQGVAAMLTSKAAVQPVLAVPLSDVSAQINAVATVYGLQAAGSSQRVEMRQMIRMLAQGGLGPVPVVFRDAVGAPIPVDDGTSVPLALVVNELIVNALKHVDRPDPERPVSVSLERRDEQLQIVVQGGPARLPDNLDFDAQRGFGSGLDLVGTLLPAAGAQLRYGQRSDEVCAALWLKNSSRTLD